jgi:hypothetical protein
VRSVLSDRVLDHPDARVLTHAGADLAHVGRVLYGDPEIRRANQMIGDLERPEYRVPATYHNAFDLERDGHYLQRNADNLERSGISVTSRDRLHMETAKNGADSHYGSGRGVDEQRSARLVEARALSLGYDPAGARAMREMVEATRFDEATKTQAGTHDPNPFNQALVGDDLQTLAEPELTHAFDLAVEDGAAERAAIRMDRIPGRVFADHDERITSTREGLEAYDRHGSKRAIINGEPSARTVRETLGDHLLGTAGFEKNYQPPETWTLDNPAMRNDHAEAIGPIGQAVRDGELSAVDAYDRIALHDAKMREKYQQTGE